MTTVFKEFGVRGVEVRAVDDVPVFPKGSSRDTHPDDLHDRSRAGGSIGGVNLACAGFKGVDRDNSPESMGKLQRHGLGFDNCKSLSVDIVHHVVAGHVHEECRVIPVCRQISSCALDNKYFKMTLDLGDIELQGELEANSNVSGLCRL